MYTTNDILTLASGIYSDLGSPPNISVGYISGYITSSGTLGDLNNKLCTSFYLNGADPDIVDPFGPEEGNIVELMFRVQFFSQQAMSVLAVGGASYWTSLTEADTKITRNPIEYAKQYLAWKVDAQSQLRLAIHDYQLRLSVPAQIVNANWGYGGVPYCPPSGSS